MDPIEENANRIIVWAVENGKRQFDGNGITKALGLKLEDIRDAFDLLKRKGAVHLYRDDYGSISPRGKILYHEIKGTVNIVRKNAYSIADFLMRNRLVSEDTCWTGIISE